MVVAVDWAAKLGATSIGIVFVCAGLAGMRFGGPLVARLNEANRRLPRAFHYPVWWHRALGGFVTIFGLLICVLGGALAGR